MITRSALGTSLALLLGVAGCGAASLDDGTLSQADRNGTNDNGTRLGTAPPAGPVACAGPNMGTIALSGTLTSTAAADTAVITVSIDVAAETQVGVITPQDFSKGGRDKSAPYSVNLNLPNGVHTVTLCFTQNGAQGRHPKRVCSAPITETVNCPSTPPSPPGPGAPGPGSPMPQPVPEITLG